MLAPPVSGTHQDSVFCGVLKNSQIEQRWKERRKGKEKRKVEQVQCECRVVRIGDYVSPSLYNPIHFSLYTTYYLVKELEATHHVTVIPVSENDQRHPFLLHINAQFVDLPNVEIPLRIYDEQST